MKLKQMSLLNRSIQRIAICLRNFNSCVKSAVQLTFTIFLKKCPR